MQKIAQYDGLYEEVGVQPDAGYLYAELLETRSRDFEWRIRPHYHSRLFQLFLIEQGQFEFVEAKDRHQLEGPCVLLIPPMAVHGFTYDGPAKGYILTVSESLMDILFAKAPFIVPMVSEIQHITLFEEFASPNVFREMATAIYEEFYAADRPGRLFLLHTYVQQYFLMLYRLWKSKHRTASERNDVSYSYFRELQLHIRQYGNSRSVTELAKEQSITAVHLNRVCQAVVGKSVSQLLHEHILNEARTYLNYTSNSIAQISDLLHFEYPNYFARFFKKHTGMTPSAFRKRSIVAH